VWGKKRNSVANQIECRHGFQAKDDIFDLNFAIFSEPHQKSRRQIDVVQQEWLDDRKAISS
jgi:hypothetical protein